MSYIKKTWIDDELITAYDLNNIENGIYTLDSQSHTHTNYSVLNQITSTKIQSWDNIALVNNKITSLKTLTYIRKK
jgi:hypothetical protein